MKHLFICIALLTTLPGLAQLPLRVRQTSSVPKAVTNGAAAAGGVQEPQLTPLAPNAAAMARYGDVQVNTNAGQINPSIPLYEIKLNDYTLPITLNYSSNGLKMNEVAGWAGLGWSINAMGTISRQVRSIPDEQTYGYNGGNPTGSVVERMTKDIFPGFAGVSKDQFKISCAQYRFDSEPDLFYYNFGSYGGSFFFGPQQTGVTPVKKATTIPLNDLNIEATFNGATANVFNATNKNGVITKFSINDPQGVKYEFDLSDGQALASVDDETRYGINRYNTWYLHKITTPNGNVIEFSYKYRKLTHPAVFSQKAEIPLAVVPEAPLDPITGFVERNQAEVIDYYLEQIKVNDGKDGTIRFVEQAAERNDWSFSNPDPNGNPKPHALDKISIENGTGTVIKEYGFTYVPSASRLLLQSVTERNGTESIPPHTFSYFNESSLPAYYTLNTNTFPEDYWGFYNSCSANCNLLIPQFTYQPASSPVGIVITGANKQPDLNAGRTGQLASIQYPTQGFTQFDYELNAYQDYSSDPNICTGPYSEIGRATASMSNYSAAVGGVITDTYIPVPDNIQGSRACIEISYTIQIGASASQDEIVGAVTLYDAGNVAISPPIILIAKRGRDTTVTNTMVIRGSQLTAGSLRAVAELYAENYNGAIQNNKAEIIVRINSAAPSGGLLRTAGGLRIKRVKTCPTTTDLGCTLKEYQYMLDDGKSSGQLITPFVHTYYVNKVFTVPRDNQAPKIYVIQHQGISSSSQLPIANGGGNHVYYEQVTTRDGGYDQNGMLTYNGGAVQKFTPLNQAQDYFFEADAPITLYSPVVSQDWKRGKSVATAINTESGLLLKGNNTTYDIKNEVSSQLIGLKTGVATYGQSNLDEYILLPYGLTTGFHYPTTAISTDYFYDSNNTPGSQMRTTQASSFSYSSPAHYFLTHSTTQNSKNEPVETRLFYPVDLSGDNDLGASAANVLGTGRKSPVLKQEIRTATRLTSTQKTYFNSRGLPSKTLQLYGSATTGSSIDFLAYDGKGNLAEYAANDGMHVSYVWSYNGAYPIAKVLNATRAQLAGVLGDLERVAAATDNGTIAGYGTALRSGLSAALVSSFTYKYGFGVETEVAPSGIKTAYEYDGLSRITAIRNTQGNIVKSFAYNYQPSTVPTPAPSVFTITGVTMVSCQTVTATQRAISINPQYAAINGQPVSFSVDSQLLPTTNPGPYTLNIQTDSPNITLRAVQSDVNSSYIYNWLAGCTTTATNQPPTTANAIGNQQATVGQAFNFSIPLSAFADDAGAGNLNLSVSGLPAGLSFMAGNRIISGTANSVGSFTVMVTATDAGGLSTSASFLLTVSSCFSADPYIVTGTFSAPTPVTIGAVSRMETDDMQPVTVNANASLILKAGQSIRLKPGFVIKPGALFRASNAPCN